MCVCEACYYQTCLLIDSQNNSVVSGKSILIAHLHLLHHCIPYYSVVSVLGDSTGGNCNGTLMGKKSHRDNVCLASNNRLVYIHINASILRRPLLFTSVFTGFSPRRINDVEPVEGFILSAQNFTRIGRQRKALLSILGDLAPSELFFSAW